MKVSQSGFSIIEVLVAVGITSVVSLALITLIVDQNKEIKNLSNKLQARDTEISLKNVFTSTSFCGCVFKALTFNQQTKQFNQNLISLPSNYTNVPADANTPCAIGGVLIPAVGKKIPGTDLTVAAIDVSNINEVTPGSSFYTGKISVNFANINLDRTIKPISANISFRVDTSSGLASARKLSTCSSIDSSSGGGVTGDTPMAIGIWSGSVFAPNPAADSSLPDCSGPVVSGAYCTHPLGSDTSCAAYETSSLTHVTVRVRATCSGNAKPSVSQIDDGGGM